MQKSVGKGRETWWRLNSPWGEQGAASVFRLETSPAGLGGCPLPPAPCITLLSEGCSNPVLKPLNTLESFFWQEKLPLTSSRVEKDTQDLALHVNSEGWGEGKGEVICTRKMTFFFHDNTYKKNIKFITGDKN